MGYGTHLIETVYQLLNRLTETKCWFYLNMDIINYLFTISSTFKSFLDKTCLDGGIASIRKWTTLLIHISQMDGVAFMANKEEAFL